MNLADKDVLTKILSGLGVDHQAMFERASSEATRTTPSPEAPSEPPPSSSAKKRRVGDGVCSLEHRAHIYLVYNSNCTIKPSELGASHIGSKVGEGSGGRVIEKDLAPCREPGC